MKKIIVELEDNKNGINVTLRNESFNSTKFEDICFIFINDIIKKDLKKFCENLKSFKSDNIKLDKKLDEICDKIIEEFMKDED